MKKLDQLTVTRFIAALSVILYHSGGVYPFDRSPFAEWFASGPIAVNYFFALSGFVMCLAYFRPGKKLDLAHYYQARFSRIYPTYLLSFLLTFIYYFDLMTKMDGGKLLANLFLLQAWIPEYVLLFNFVAWSLSVEVFFYVIFPFLIPLFVRLTVRRLIWCSAIVWGISIMIHSSLFGFFQHEQDYILYYNPLVYLSGFILGCAAGSWFLQVDRKQIKQPVNFLFLLIGLGFLAAALIAQRQLAQIPAFVTLTTGLLTPAFILIILTLALDETFVTKILKNKWLILLGDSSYALFILNLPVRWIIERILAGLHLNVSNNLFYYIFIPFMVLLSILVNQKFEYPARNWLLANQKILPLFLLDATFISLAVWIAYFLRLGVGSFYFDNRVLVTFTLRVAIPVVMIVLFLLRLYQPVVLTISGRELARQIFAPIVLSGILLSGTAYLAFRNGMITTFPRSALLICFVTLFAFAWLSRVLFSHWTHRVANRVNTIEY